MYFISQVTTKACSKLDSVAHTHDGLEVGAPSLIFASLGILLGEQLELHLRCLDIQ
jgi:hypothetical protein